MTTRIPLFAGLAPAIVFGLLAGSLQPTSLRADDCLPGPKGAAPKGGHWYYRVDRTTKKNCWYVRAEKRQTPSADSAEAQDLPRAETPLQPSVANARAEADPASVGQSNGAQQAAPAAATVSVPESNTAAADSGPSTLASRWLDQPVANTINPSVETAGSGASPNLAPPSAAPPAPAEIRAPSPFPFPPLLLVMLGALTVAGGVAGVMFRVGSARRQAHEDLPERPAPWDVMEVGATIHSPPLATEAALPQSEPVRDRHDAVIPDEIVQLLATLSKEAPA